MEQAYSVIVKSPSFGVRGQVPDLVLAASDLEQGVYNLCIYGHSGADSREKGRPGLRGTEPGPSGTPQSPCPRQG